MTTSVNVSITNANAGSFPPFVPHPLLRNGHLQTLAGRYFPAWRGTLAAERVEIDLGDGDWLCVLDSIPTVWQPGKPAALLVHGLGGCAESPYVVRVASRFQRLGIRTVRMNLRGAGAGFGRARGIYHAGRTEDVRRVVEWLALRATGSPIALVGFSLGGNLVLKLAAEAVDQPLPGFDCVLAANPPIDLAACCRHIQQSVRRLYDRNFVRQLRREVDRLHAIFPELGQIQLSEVQTLYEFDHVYTAPRNGFDGAEDYYRRSSAATLIPRIEAPGLVVHAQDDPFIPANSFRREAFPSQLSLEMSLRGGHLGYVSRTRFDSDHRWLDARFEAWLAAHWGGRQ